MYPTAVGRDIEAAVHNRDGSDEDDDDEIETPEMNLTVSLLVLLATTGLTCKSGRTRVNHHLF